MTFLLADIRLQVLKQTRFGESHYIAGKIEAPAGNLKVKKLDADNFAIVVSAQAYPDGSLYNPETATKNHSTARLYTGLFVRHWDKWSTKEKNALWYGKLSRKGQAKFKLSGLCNATTSTRLESPIQPFGGTDNFDVSTEGIIFVAKDPDLIPALNTKENVYLLHIPDWDGDEKPSIQQIVVPGFEGAASSPVFSKDGRRAAFLMMKTRGYEADRNQIFVVSDLKSAQINPQRAYSTTEEGTWDRSPGSVVWSADAKSLLVTAEENGEGKLFQIPVDLPTQEPRTLVNHGYITDIRPLPNGKIFVSGSSLGDNSFFVLVDPQVPPNGGGSNVTWTNSNSADGTKFGLKPEQIDSIWTPASNPKVNKYVHSIVIRPSNFDRSKKYPVAYLIHGGPQGAWGDNWSTRWNPMVFAEQGYIVIAPNPTGSTGYGQAFTDAIRRNWGGDPYQDIVNVFQWASKNLPEADHDRAVALGASYGGYMMNW